MQLEYWMKQTTVLLLIVLLSIVLTACSSNNDSRSQVEAKAREIMTADGFGDAQITNIVAGDPASRGADELYCVATNATTQNGELPYLLVIWRTGSTWDGAQLAEGYYDWDLNGCPR